MSREHREQTGSFYTPEKWVKLSQRYMRETWPDFDDCYLWDCAAGTGNLLIGLTNKLIFASTLEVEDVDIIKQRLPHTTAFQFDFLNDDFSKLPPSLLSIIRDPEERKKLVVYINPPYAEIGNPKQIHYTGVNKPDFNKRNRLYRQYKPLMGVATNELSTFFLIHTYQVIRGCRIGVFSKPKIIQSPNYTLFHKGFQATLEKVFTVPANSFDGVTGKWAVCFMLWNTAIYKPVDTIATDVYNTAAVYQGQCLFYMKIPPTITGFIPKYNPVASDSIGVFTTRSSSFSQQDKMYIAQRKNIGNSTKIGIVGGNLIQVAIYSSVVLCMRHTWLNDTDQFLYPTAGWEKDTEFHNDCLAFILFHNKLHILRPPNHWIPFTEEEVGVKGRFSSHWMIDFLQGKPIKYGGLFSEADAKKTRPPLLFSPEATAIFDTAREIWRYYHKQEGAITDASFFMIRQHFQGLNYKGHIQQKSKDEHYTALKLLLKEKTAVLADKIAIGMYKYRFLRKTEVSA